MKKPMFGAVAAAVLAFATAAAAQEPANFDHMTCQQARDYVQKNGRIYTNGANGQAPIAIYPVRSIDKGPSCANKQAIWREIHKTADDAQCFMGWSCGVTN